MSEGKKQYTIIYEKNSIGGQWYKTRFDRVESDDIRILDEKYRDGLIAIFYGWPRLIGEDEVFLPDGARDRAQHNRSKIDTWTRCGCYACIAMFHGESIREWADDGDTALCPLCRSDTVIPEVAHMDLLRQVNEIWFGGERPV